MQTVLDNNEEDELDPNTIGPIATLILIVQLLINIKNYICYRFVSVNLTDTEVFGLMTTF